MRATNWRDGATSAGDFTRFLWSNRPDGSTDRAWSTDRIAARVVVVARVVRGARGAWCVITMSAPPVATGRGDYTMDGWCVGFVAKARRREAVSSGGLERRVRRRRGVFRGHRPRLIGCRRLGNFVRSGRRRRRRRRRRGRVRRGRERRSTARGRRRRRRLGKAMVVRQWRSTRRERRWHRGRTRHSLACRWDWRTRSTRWWSPSLAPRHQMRRGQTLNLR